MSLCDADMRELLRLAELGQRTAELQKLAVELAREHAACERQAQYYAHLEQESRHRLEECLAELKEHFAVIQG